jgi:hypothetical protein
MLLAMLLAAASPQDFVNTHCVGCHNQKLKTGGLALDRMDASRPASDAEVWERVVDKLRARSMPPPGVPRPPADAYRQAVAAIEAGLDRSASPPRRAGPVHRLNRLEYQNAVRDLLALDFDAKSQLPGDETADGSFDNFADVLTISTAHLERYLSVARQVTRLAVGLPPARPKVETFPIPLHVLQNDRQSEDLPLGTRGGIAVRHNFPVDGDYTVKVRLQRQYQDYLKGMGWAQRLDVRIDGKLVRRFTVGGGAKGRPAAASYAGDGEPGFAGDPEWERYMQVDGDAGLEVRTPVKAGPRVVGVSFVRELWEPEGLPQPLQRGRVIADDQVYMDHANVASIQIGGPYSVAGTMADTPSRRAIFVCRPTGPADERACAARILARLARAAYRRATTKADIDTLMGFFDTGRREAGSFDDGIQFALERLLVDPDFLLRLHRGRPHEAASRLSFFLWSSIPDESLLSKAERGQLASPEARGAEIRRMLADRRAPAGLVQGFASQWLNLRRVAEVVVDPIRYPNYDESLLQAFQRETELFLEDSISRDRPVTELLTANHTFVNERLARHYGIPGIYGSQFRRVTLPNPEQRGGVLAHGAVLATTAYPDRTSPVLRGKWLLNNILGLQAPLPPPGLDTNLAPEKPGRALSIRQRLAEHRRNPACNSCHELIDPLGFALENFDVIGGWRSRDEAGNPVDNGGLGLAGLRAKLLEDPEQFPRTVAEKLMSYAMGRRLDYRDRPAVRGIVRRAAPSQYRWSAIAIGIGESILAAEGR